MLYLLSGCDAPEITTPYAKNLAIIKVAGDSQVSSPGATLNDYLAVRIEHVNTGEPAAGVLVSWRVQSGDGAQPTPEIVRTDANGLAFTRVKLGMKTGAYIIEASFQGLWGNAARFTISAR